MLFNKQCQGVSSTRICPTNMVIWRVPTQCLTIVIVWWVATLKVGPRVMVLQLWNLLLQEAHLVSF